MPSRRHESDGVRAHLKPPAENHVPKGERYSDRDGDSWRGRACAREGRARDGCAKIRHANQCDALFRAVWDTWQDETVEAAGVMGANGFGARGGVRRFLVACDDVWQINRNSIQLIYLKT